jgi:HEAT repeat protein
MFMRESRWPAVETTKKTIRIRFGFKALIFFVAVCAVLFGALRFSRDSRPAYLYAGWLGEGDDSRRVHAAQELGGLDEDTSVVAASLIRALLTDRAVAVRKQAAQSLGRIVSKRDDGPTTTEAASALVQALLDNDPAVRAAVADALGRIGPESEVAVTALLRSSDDDDEWVRGAAVAALGLIQKKAQVDRTDVRPAIVAAMIHPSLHVRELGLYALWATAEASPGFSRALLMNNDMRVRRAAIHALARSGPLAEKVSRELTARLTDADEEVRAGATRALENMGIAPTPE